MRIPRADPAHPPDIAALILCLGGELLSIIACTRLLHAVPGGVACQRQRRLFLRQLKLLALVDLIGSIVLAGLDSIRFGLIGLVDTYPTTAEDLVLPNKACKWICGFYWWLRFSSVFIETHIAVGVVIGWRRWRRCMHHLFHSVLLQPVIAVAFAIGAVFTSPCHYNGFTCIPVQGEYLSFGVLVFCYLLSLVCYGLAFFTSYESPGTVQKATLWRSVVYSLNFLFSYGPSLFILFSPASMVQVVWLAVLADFSEGLNGFLNCTAYFLQAGAARRKRLLLGNGATAENRAICEADAQDGDGRGPLPPRSFASAASLHVCFDPTSNEIEEIPVPCG